MSAGTGIFHSEYNKNQDIPVQLLQIWVFPKEKNITPRYDQKKFDAAGRLNHWQLLVSPDDPDVLWINQQAWFSRITLEESISVEYPVHDDKNGVYIFVIDGNVETAGQLLEKRDGLGVSETTSFSLNAGKKSEILVIEVP